MQVVFEISGQRYAAPVNFTSIQMIEEELGSLNRLIKGFEAEDWRACDVVHLLHILVGAEFDFSTLGETVIEAGVMSFVPGLVRYLTLALLGEK